MWVLIESCARNSEDKVRVENNLTIAQKEFSKIVSSVKMRSEIKELLSKHFDDGVEIFNGDNFIFYEHLYLNLLNNLKANNNPLIYWNDEIMDVSYLDWSYDTSNCSENVLVLFDSDPKGAQYCSVCFNESGKVISIMPIYSPNTGGIVWLR